MKKLIPLLLVTMVYAVPPYISYQGLLHDDQGVPINGTIEIMFRLYTESSGGTALWSETQSVLISDGLFNVKLGSVMNLPHTVFDSDTLFLGIKVGSDPEMTPRQVLTSMPFSFRSQVSVPIGTVMAWHKSLPNTPTLPFGWVECDGQTLSDLESPYDGVVIPNLNGESRVLRGNASSGATGGNDSHNHQWYGDCCSGSIGLTIGYFSSSGGRKFYDVNGNPTSNYQNGNSGAFMAKAYTNKASNLPPYMDMVWIIRVK